MPLPCSLATTPRGDLLFVNEFWDSMYCYAKTRYGENSVFWKIRFVSVGLMFGFISQNSQRLQHLSLYIFNKHFHLGGFRWYIALQRLQSLGFYWVEKNIFGNVPSDFLSFILCVLHFANFMLSLKSCF